MGLPIFNEIAPKEVIFLCQTEEKALPFQQYQIKSVDKSSPTSLSLAARRIWYLKEIQQFLARIMGLIENERLEFLLMALKECSRERQGWL